eukprot:gene7902-16175_t
MSGFGTENSIVIGILIVVIGVYIYLLLSPTQPTLPKRPRSFVISRNTKSDFEDFMKEFRESQNYSSSSWSGGGNSNYTFDDYGGDWGEWKNSSGQDDFFLEPSYDKEERNSEEIYKPIEPSAKFHCMQGWLSIRSELNYKFLWLHGNIDMWLSATATLDTPLHRKTFEMVPVTDGCGEGGWVRLREGDNKNFLYMAAPSGEFAVDEWAVKMGSSDLTVTSNDTRHQNKAAMACMNVMSQAEYGIRGHTSGWDRTKASGREYSATMHFQFINGTDVEAAVAKEKDQVHIQRSDISTLFQPYDYKAEQREADEQDKVLLGLISAYPPSKEKRVISFGLYGSKDKYTIGAVKNAELAKVYFPDWVCRYYITSDVPPAIVTRLKDLGAELENVPPGMGYASGMFWRFMVGADSSVDRYIVRDVDSRLNARDRVAVEEWVTSKYAVHILRDHVNHCLPINGGMWGGTKDAIPNLKEIITNWKSRDEYSADLHFLEEKIWPVVRDKQISHDSYCCDRYPNARPFPSRRSPTYQHVGQVFDSEDRPRYMDIDAYIRGVPIPSSCRKDPSWIYGYESELRKRLLIPTTGYCWLFEFWPFLKQVECVSQMSIYKEAPLAGSGDFMRLSTNHTEQQDNARADVQSGTIFTGL